MRMVRNCIGIIVFRREIVSKQKIKQAFSQKFRVLGVEKEVTKESLQMI